MSAVVVDAGVLAAALAQDSVFGDNARAAVRGRSLHLPAHGPVEALSVLRKWARDGTVPQPRADGVVASFAKARLTVHDQLGLIARTWELRHSVSAYDAAYVALAEDLGCEIVTTDGRLAGAPGPRCPITLVART